MQREGERIYWLKVLKHKQKQDSLGKRGRARGSKIADRTITVLECVGKGRGEGGERGKKGKSFKFNKNTSFIVVEIIVIAFLYFF